MIKVYPVFFRNVRYNLNLFETVWHESKHNLFDLSSSSSLKGSLSLSNTDNNLLRIKQQGIEHAKITRICRLNINSIRKYFIKLHTR